MLQSLIIHFKTNNMFMQKQNEHQTFFYIYQLIFIYLFIATCFINYCNAYDNWDSGSVAIQPKCNGATYTESQQQQLISISIQKRWDRKQIMPSVIILGWINALPRLQGYVLGLWPSSNPYRLGRALIQPKIITLGIICIVNKLEFSLRKLKFGLAN